ncbi:holo-ACP synthase [Dehalobacter sp. DCM]|uniref:holo-ACP synthase n=1 Tax=Dehalobacter sp. DCM TaxID=2907827 RepID=UPI003081D6B0|nr:holo-ACP synthase [Dehalobacter sp. DCM]
MYPGIDIIEISRFEQAYRRHPRLAARLFTEKELALLENKNIASLAARFAGKEAVLKALGIGLSGVSWHDIEIFQNTTGEPYVVLSDRACIIARARGAGIVRLSLSHTKEMAIASAILV